MCNTNDDQQHQWLLWMNRKVDVSVKWPIYGSICVQCFLYIHQNFHNRHYFSPPAKSSPALSRQPKKRTSVSFTQAQVLLRLCCVTEAEVLLPHYKNWPGIYITSPFSLPSLSPPSLSPSLPLSTTHARNTQPFKTLITQNQPNVLHFLSLCKAKYHWKSLTLPNSGS